MDSGQCSRSKGTSPERDPHINTSSGIRQIWATVWQVEASWIGGMAFVRKGSLQRWMTKSALLLLSSLDPQSQPSLPKHPNKPLGCPDLLSPPCIRGIISLNPPQPYETVSVTMFMLQMSKWRHTVIKLVHSPQPVRRDRGLESSVHSSFLWPLWYIFPLKTLACRFYLMDCFYMRICL